MEAALELGDWLGRFIGGFGKGWGAEKVWVWWFARGSARMHMLERHCTRMPLVSGGEIRN